MRKVIKFRPYIFLVCCCAFLFVSCNSDELNEDLPNEEVIENITGASFGKYQQLSIDEVTGFVDGIEFNKPLKDGSGMTALNAGSEFLVGLDASSLAFEQVEGAELKIPTVKARLKHPEVRSKIFVVKVKDSTLAFLMNIVEDKSINDEDFSGIIGITDLSGKFENGYRLKNGEFVSQFVVAKAQQKKDSVGVTKKTLSYTTRTVPKKKWMSGTIQLSEVSVYAPEEPSNSGGGSYGGLSVRGGNYFGGYSFGFSFGGPPRSGGGSSSSSGGSSGSGKGGAINVFPCDDPLHGCANDLENAYEFFLENNVWNSQGPYDDWNRLTNCEKDFFRNNPQHLFIARGNKKLAEKVSWNRFKECGTPSGAPMHNTIGDAYRHAYFAALNTHNMGYTNAKALGDAHECDVPPYRLNEKQMDLYNNDWGYLYGSTVSFINEKQFYNSFMDAVSKGKIKIIQECQ